MDALTNLNPSEAGGSARGQARLPTVPAYYRPRLRRLEDRVLLSATPVATVVDLPDEELINESFTFGVTFDNTGADPQGTGYGPFVDVTVGPGIEVNDVTYLGVSLQTEEVGTWDGTQWVDSSGNPVTQHPLDNVGGQLALPIGSTVGETWINVLAPFGSYTPDQPAIDLVFSATLDDSPDANPETGAVPGEDITVTARGGFQFGLDPLDNPTTDPPVQQGAAVSDTITPIVMRLDKELQLAEGETAQGPNFPFTYTISVDIATGVTVTDINIEDLLPTNLFFLTATTNVAASSQTAPGVGGTAEGVPGIDTITTAQWTFDTVTGRTGEGDIVITLTAYAPEFAADGTDLDEMNVDSPAAYLATNQAEVVSASYAAADGSEVAINPDNSGQLEDSIDVIIRPYTVLKMSNIEGGGAAAPGKYVQYTIEADISDYLALREAVLTDVLADGLTLDTTDNATLDHTPVLRVEMNGQVYLFPLTQTLEPGDETEIATTFQANGSQSVTFFLSAAVRNAGALDEILYGDLFNGDAQQGPTRVTLTYYALIEENYRNGGAPVVVSDTLANSVNATLNSATGDGTNPAQPDGSGSDVDITPPNSTKSVLAINGQPPSGGSPTIAPGDTVTYRIRIEVSSADVNDLNITDFLPSPVFDVDGNGSGFVFVGGTGTPAPYQVTLGTGDTLISGGIAPNPTVTTNGAANSINFSFADFDLAPSQSGVIELLYTITATDHPFADGLLLTNQAQIQNTDSQGNVDTDIIIDDVVLRQPVLSLTKGTVATDADGAVDNSLAFDPTRVAPGKMTFALGAAGFTTTSTLTAADLATTPIDSNMSGFDAGDTVKFAVTVQNTGGQDAFDVVINDTLPPGFAIPAGAVLTVQYGDGSLVSFTGTIDDFFGGTGITINDDDANGLGGIAAGGAANGHDIIIISYELVAVDNLNPGITVNNTAEILSFAAIEGGNDFTEGVDGQFTDDAELTAQTVEIDKRLIATDQGFTTGDDLTIGEIGTFQIEVTLPDGATQAIVTDVLPQGMALVGTPVLLLTFINANGETVTFEGIVQQGGGALSDGSALAFTQTGNTLTFDFSNLITNAAPGTDLSGQSFVIQYQAQATDDPALDAGTRAINTATLDTPTTNPVSDTEGVDIVEPNLTITKTFSPDKAQGNESVLMTYEIVNGSGTFDTTAFGLTITDADTDMTGAVFASIVQVSVSGTGSVQTQLDANPSLVTVTITPPTDPSGNFVITVVTDPTFAIAKGEKLLLGFNVTIQPDAIEGTVVENTATIDSYSSLSGNQLVERVFGPTSGSDTLTISGPEIEKFLLNTSLGGQPIAFPMNPALPTNPDPLDPDPNVVVGEVLTYVLKVSFPVGQADNVIMFDDTDFFNAAGAVGIVGIVSVDQVRVGSNLVLSNPDALTVGNVVVSDTNGDGINNRLQLNIGGVLNVGDPDNPVPLEESIFLVFRAQVMNVVETDSGDVHVNGARVTYDVAGVAQNFDDSVNITITEPAIDVAKTVTGVTPDLDAGDELTYTLTLSHNDTLSTGDGYALTLTDQIPPNLQIVPGSVVFNGFTAAGFDGDANIAFDAATNTLTVNGFDLPRTQTVTITYRVTVAEAVVQGEALTNEVQLTYQSLPDFDPADGFDPSRPVITDFNPSLDPEDDATYIAGSVSQTRDGSDMVPRNVNSDDPNEVNNYFFETEQTVTIADPGPIVKTVDKPTATIGEIVTYTFEIPVIEGTTVNPLGVDILPPGITFLPGTGTVEDGDGNPITGFVFTQSGQTLTLDLEDFVTPGDNDLSNDFLRVTFQARVDNVFENQNNDSKPNTVTWTHDNGSSSDDASFSIVEPELVLTKTHDAPATVDAGDEITFTVTAQHSSSSKSDAFEFTFTDSIPEDFAASLVRATVNGVDVLDQIEIVGNTIQTIDGADIDIPLGATFELVYTVSVQNTVGPSETIPNGVLGRWSSLDGSVNPGSPTGERIGNLPRDVNDYVATAQAQVVTDSVIDLVKSVSVPQATIGETVTYTLDVKVFEGTLQNVVVQDLTEAGQRIDLSSLTIIPSGFAGAAGLQIVGASLVPSPNVPGASLLTFQLQNSADGSLLNPGDPIGDLTDNDTIRITYTAVVTNERINQDGEQIDNAADVQADNTIGATGAASLAIVEPVITVDKTVLTDPAQIQDAGDVVTYQVVLTNIGTSDAFDVTFTDTAPADTNFTGDVLDENGVVVGGFTVTAGQITGTINQIAVGGTVRLTYSLVVANTASPNETLTNDVDVRWTSTSGTNPDERDGSEGLLDGDFTDDAVPVPPDSTDPNDIDPDDNLNNYQAVDDATVQLGAFPISIEKSLESSSVAETVGNQLTIGETGDFALDITVSEGTTSNLMVVDVTESWMGIDLSSLTVEDIGFAGGDVTIVNPTLDVNPITGVATLSFQLDNTPGTPEIQLVNPGDNASGNDTIRVTYRATVLDNILNQDGDVISNTATVSAGGGIAPDDATETISLVEPDLVIDKRALLPLVPVGGTAPYEIRVNHTANSHVDAFDLVVSDPFNDPLLTLNPGSITATVEGGSGTAVVTLVGTGFQVNLDKLERNATLVIRFTAQSVVVAGADGATIPNTSTLGYDTIPDVQAPDEQRGYTRSDTDSVTIVGPDLQLVKEASVDIVEPGELFTYDIEVLNVGAPNLDNPVVETARNVVFTDVLPVDVELLSVSVDGVDTPFTFDLTTRVITVALADIPPDQTRLITLFMQASDTFSPAPSGGTGDVQLINVAEVDMIQTDPTPENNIDDATITTRAIPDLVVTKTNAVEVIGGSETVEFTLTAQNVGDRVAAGVQIIDRVDTTVFEFVSASDGGVFDPVSGTVTWRLDTLSPDDGVLDFTMVLRVRPGLPPSIDDTTDVVTINDNGQGGPDPTPQNNIDTHTDRLIYPDLVITKANGVDEVSPGDIVDYAITVQNVGEFRADGVVVRDVIDTRVFRFVSATNGGVFDPATGVVTWRLGTVNPGDPPIILGLTLEVMFPTSADIDQAVNVVEVNGDGTRGRDANPNNNIATDSDILNAAPDPFEIERVLGDDEEEEEEEIEEPLYIAPIFTGKSATGAQVRITLIGPGGAPIDTGTTVASPDGNWILMMKDVEGPAPVSAIVTTSPPTVTALGPLDRTNVFFNPGANTPIDFHRRFDVFSAMDSGSDVVLRDQMAASEDPLAVTSRRYINFNEVGGTAISDY
ncbi:isopeptide-forming domain-containing fimbrial protein [Mesorhizobium sp. 1B3]|uniref:isopeptide-forming domain-containing fimbrial protein n=1 Tax=Mesorhizobium sp. 1B3 TaxID=3243599 RepID=UPI003D982235